MTPELMRLDEQLRRAFEGDAWHGPSVLEALDGVSASQAAARPLDSVHSIWELVLHLRGICHAGQIALLKKLLAKE